MIIYSLPQLDWYKKRPVRSKYPLSFSNTSIRLYITWLDLLFGMLDIEKAWLCISCFKVIVNSWFGGAFSSDFCNLARISCGRCEKGNFVECNPCASYLWCSRVIACVGYKYYFTSFFVKAMLWNDSFQWRWWRLFLLGRNTLHD